MSSHIPDPNKNVSLTIDGRPVTVPEGTTILEAAKRAHIDIPVLCHHPGLKVRAVCRLCAVECDGGRKLKAACSNAVAEGLNVVTDNPRLRAIRRTILELILAEHPQGCLTCVRNQTCELQALARRFGLPEPVFQPEARAMAAVADSETLVRDMAKCVKCGRCVEMCQEVQTVRAINTSHRSVEYEIATPYEKPLFEGPCVHCGQCAAVCPVGALYEYDQTAAVLAALADESRHVAARLDGGALAGIAAELGLAEAKAGQVATALKMLGFAHVYGGGAQDEAAEVAERQKSGGALPLISAKCPAAVNFVHKFFPDLAGHLAQVPSPQQAFGRAVKKSDGAAYAVSIAPCLAKKFEAQRDGDVDVALTPREVGRLLRSSGLALPTLAETPLEALPGAPAQAEALEVSGLGNARKLLEDIAAGRYQGAQFVKLASCPGGCLAD